MRWFKQRRVHAAAGEKKILGRGKEKTEKGEGKGEDGRKWVHKTKKIKNGKMKKYIKITDIGKLGKIRTGEKSEE